MASYGCRHTFISDRVLQPWTLTCVVCLRPVAPFTALRRCTSCKCVVHDECYRQLVDLIHAAGDVVGQSATAAAAAAATAPTEPPPSLFDDEDNTRRDGPSGVPVASSAAPAAPHRHVLRPTHALLPTMCADCLSLKSAEAKRAAAAEAGRRSNGSVQLTDAAGPASCWMGFGTPAYECTDCGANFHRACLYCMQPSAFTLIAPPARQLHGGAGAEASTRASLTLFNDAVEDSSADKASDANGSSGGAGESPQALTDAFRQFMRSFRASKDSMSASSPTATTASTASLREAGKALVRSYLDAAGRHSEKDPNVSAILTSLFALMDDFQERYPDLLKSLFNPLRMHALSQQDEAMYHSSCQRLPDADFILAIERRACAAAAAKAAATATESSVTSSVSQTTVELQCASVGAPPSSSSIATAPLVNREEPVPGAGSAAATAAAAGALNADARDAGTEARSSERVSSSSSGRDVSATTATMVTTRITATTKTATAAGASTAAGLNATMTYTPEVQALRDALRFAIAVYGETYRQGSLSSLFGSALVFTVNKDDVARATKETNDRAVTDVLALPASSLVLSNWSSTATEPSYALLLDHFTQRIVLTFRGTLSDVDILTDVCAFGEPFCGGRAHQGAARCIHGLFDARAAAHPAPQPSPAPAAAAAVAVAEGSVEDGMRAKPMAPTLSASGSRAAGEGLLDALERLAERHPAYEIVVTGHSLGGGLAVLFGVRLSHDRPFREDILHRFRVVAFAPMPTLSLPAAAEYDPPRDASGEAASSGQGVTGEASASHVSSAAASSSHTAAGSHYAFPIVSVVNGCDVVPRLQLNSLDRLCGSICATPTAASATPPTAAPNASAAAAAPSSSVSSAPPVRAATSGVSDELHHPGRVLMLTTPWEPKTNRLIEIPRGDALMHQLFLMRPMLTLHMMNNYTEGLRVVRSAAQIARSTTPS